MIGNSLDEEESELFPAVFRSGSCAEGGPKQFMEDEHVCIDNLVDHLSATTSANCPSPGAFYGVSIFETFDLCLWEYGQVVSIWKWVYIDFC